MYVQLFSRLYDPYGNLDSNGEILQIKFRKQEFLGGGLGQFLLRISPSPHNISKPRQIVLKSAQK